MRLTPAARCSGVTAMSAMIVEQLGLAMMPPCPSFTALAASGFTCTRGGLPHQGLRQQVSMPWLCQISEATVAGSTSGMTSGTPSAMRNAELLSTICSAAANSQCKAPDRRVPASGFTYCMMANFSAARSDIHRASRLLARRRKLLGYGAASAEERQLHIPEAAMQHVDLISTMGILLQGCLLVGHVADGACSRVGTSHLSSVSSSMVCSSPSKSTFFPADLWQWCQTSRSCSDTQPGVLCRSATAAAACRWYASMRCITWQMQAS